jgi:hypothetical protein
MEGNRGGLGVDMRTALAVWSSPGGHAVILGGLGAHEIWAVAFSIFFLNVRYFINHNGREGLGASLTFYFFVFS